MFFCSCNGGVPPTPKLICIHKSIHLLIKKKINIIPLPALRFVAGNHMAIEDVSVNGFVFDKGFELVKDLSLFGIERVWHRKLLKELAFKVKKNQRFLLHFMGKFFASPVSSE